MCGIISNDFLTRDWLNELRRIDCPGRERVVNGPEVYSPSDDPDLVRSFGLKCRAENYDEVDIALWLWYEFKLPHNPQAPCWRCFEEQRSNEPNKATHDECEIGVVSLAGNCENFVVRFVLLCCGVKVSARRCQTLALSSSTRVAFAIDSWTIFNSSSLTRCLN